MANENLAYTVFTFVSTHHALKAEQVLKQERLQGTIMPVPRELSSLCGLAIRVEPSLREQVESVLRNKGVGIDEIVELKPRFSPKSRLSPKKQ